MGRIGAECDFTLHSERTSMSKAEWDKKRLGWVCTDSTNFAKQQAAITKFCRDTNRCDYEMVKSLEDFNNRIQSISQEAKETWQRDLPDHAHNGQ